MGDSAGNWSLIESDPGVFTELIRKFGATGVQVEELWGLDDESFERFKPIHGLIFLFKWIPDDELSGTLVVDDRLKTIFFAKQVINNACATQAIISILLNCKHPDLNLGPELTKLKEFSMSFDPKMRGLTLSNCQTIREVHNSMARQVLFEFETKVPSPDDDTFHFIGYMPIDGRIYELDGLKEGPIDLGPVTPGQEWISNIQPIIRRRIDQYSDGDIHFNLLAVVSDRRMLCERELKEILENTDDTLMETDEVQNEVSRLQFLIDSEHLAAHMFQMELARRRHNYLPFIIELLKVLGADGKLMNVYNNAKERAIRRALRKAHRRSS